MKKKKLAIASLLMALLMPLAVYAEGDAPAEAAPIAWDVSCSKTATDLDADYTSQVTLSLPSEEEILASDVVFVLDVSDCVGPVMNQVSELVAQLKTAQEKNNADIKVGAVIFKGSAYTMFDGNLVDAASAIAELEDLSNNVHEEKDVLSYFGLDKDTDFVYKGSNLHAGLRTAQKLLASDNTVEDGRKYLVSITDGMTYYWNDEQDNVYGVYSQPNKPKNDLPNLLFYAWCQEHEVDSSNHYALPSGFNWADYLTIARAQIAADNNQYRVNVRETTAKLNTDYSNVRFPGKQITELVEADIPVIPDGENDIHAHGIDYSVVACLDTYQEMVNAGYQCYTLNPDYDTNAFPGLFTAKLNEMANKSVIDFDSIKNDILYAVGAGSTVEDVIGNDFTLDVDSLSVSVGGVELTKESLAENSWAFGDDVPATNRFVVSYDPAAKKITWYINKPVTNFARVQLSYKVKLTNPKTEPGTYTAVTNEWAKLYPMGSTGAVGQAVEFPKPEVSYSIYALNYDANGGSGAPDGEVNCTGKFTVSDTVPTRDGYTFAGWNTAADGSGTSYAAGSSVELGKESPALTLYAQWNKPTPATVTVHFDLCGHGGAGVPDQTFVSGGKASEPAAPKEDGWVFGGWYTDRSCQYRFNFDGAVTSDITLYAKWDRVTTVVSAPVATPTPSPAPAAAATTTTKTVKNAAIPQTSDAFPLEGLLALLAVGAVGFGAAGWLRKKHH